MKKRYLVFMSLILFSVMPFSLKAQTEEPTPPSTANPETPIPLVHAVEEGENLTYIAQLYGTTVDALLTINNLSPDTLLYVGQELIIPGGEGEAIATVYTIQPGDTLAQVAALFNTTDEAVLASNQLIHTDYEFIPGQTLSVVSRTGSALPQEMQGTPHVVTDNESLLLLAARYNLSPAALAEANSLPFPTYLYPGQRLRIPSEETYRFLPGEWKDIQIRPSPITPGATIVIYVQNALDGRPAGQFGEQPLQFAPHEEGFVALLGLDAFADTGLYTLELSGSGSQPWQRFQQQIPVLSGIYSTQFITVPDSLSPLLDPQIRQDEDEFLQPIYTRYTDTQRWDGLFQAPVTNTVITAGYGDDRSYNGGPIEIFHTGVDFGGSEGTMILAPANGLVIFSEELQLRGLTTIIDHGLGVMTAYFHQSESFVTVDEEVVTGQPIGAIGSTGLSSGPHLHWDVRIMNVPVNGLQWLNESFP